MFKEKSKKQINLVYTCVESKHDRERRLIRIFISLIIFLILTNIVLAYFNHSMKSKNKELALWISKIQRLDNSSNVAENDTSNLSSIQHVLQDIYLFTPVMGQLTSIKLDKLSLYFTVTATSWDDINLFSKRLREKGLYQVNLKDIKLLKPTRDKEKISCYSADFQIFFNNEVLDVRGK
jgi:hypothetical protein